MGVCEMLVDPRVVIFPRQLLRRQICLGDLREVNEESLQGL